jgi:hypothetical protein
MNPDQNRPGPDPQNDTANPAGEQAAAEAAYQDEYTALWEVAVDTLTAAVRLRHPKHGELDFAGFLASALAAVAANVGSTDRVIAGRPGSWEADLVERLLTGTVANDPEELARYRTEPIVIHLNVHRLLHEDAWTRLEGETLYEREGNAIIERHENLPDADYDPAAEAAELAELKTRWTSRYAAYAQAFTAAVTAEAAHVDGLHVPVAVQAITDPDAGFEGPEPPGQDEHVDPLVWRLWGAARSSVPLPGPDDTAREQS